MTPPTTQLLGTLTLGADGAPVVAFDRAYATDPSDLWQAVTEPERLARWFAPVEGDLRAGGTFSIRFDDGDIPECRVTSCDSPRGFTWEWPHGGRTSVVEVQVLPEGGSSRLRLTHTRLTVESAPEYGAGWDAYVHRLEDHLGGREPGEWWDDFAAAKQGYAAQLG